MFSFKNIDSFKPGNFEKMGMLKGKRWYIDCNNKKQTRMGLFKPRRREFGDRKVYCANHYGEFIGYLVGINSDTKVCPAELAHLTRYYENIHKERNGATPEEKDGCISYSVLENDQILVHGKNVIETFCNEQPEKYKKLREEDPHHSVDLNDNIELCLSAIEYETRKFYASNPNVTQKYIEKKVRENRISAIEMMVYDCMYGNNDRHDENWAMVKDKYGKDISLYSLYDNERVFGLYENINIIQHCVNNDTVEKTSEEMLFSRMKVPGEKSRFSNYKDVLTYLIQNYKDETEYAISKNLASNEPKIISTYIRQCKDLPQCYIDFAEKMYKDRYDFTRELFIKSKNLMEEKNQEEIDESLR